MMFKIKAKETLYIAEWGLVVLNDLGYDIAVEVGHTELLVKTIAIKEEVDIPDAFKKE